MIAAQLRVEGELDTGLEKATYTEFFNLDSSVQGAIVNGEWKLRLENGFVRASPAPVLTYSTTVWGDYASIDSTDYAIDFEKGFVSLSPGITGVVKVVYDAGFDEADVPDNVPDFLADTIMAYTPLVMNFSNVFSRTELSSLNTLVVGHAMAVLARHRRTAGMSLYPMR
jgi:hypothetical protein